MEGSFFGGGSLEHIVKGGEIYFNSDTLAQLLIEFSLEMREIADQEGDPVVDACADTLALLSFKVDELRSELLKREIEASFKLS